MLANGKVGMGDEVSIGAAKAFAVGDEGEKFRWHGLSLDCWWCGRGIFLPARCFDDMGRAVLVLDNLARRDEAVDCVEVIIVREGMEHFGVEIGFGNGAFSFDDFE